MCQGREVAYDGPVFEEGDGMASAPRVGRRSMAGSSGIGTVLVVDDVAANARLLERLLVADGYVVVIARNGEEAVTAVAACSPDAIIMDVRMPGRDGFSACSELKQNPETRLIPVVLMTGAAERADRVRASEVGADDFLTKPIDEPELKARVRCLVRLKRYTDELDSAESVILSLARTIEARDPCTEGHCERLARYAVALGEQLGLSDEDLAALHRGGFLHDIGKIAMPDAILQKPGALTPDEYARMKTHSVVGERLCGTLRVLARVRPIVRHHHERLDGSGYPDGLCGDQIPKLAQIIGVVDVFDALTTWRPYKEPVSAAEALRELEREAARGWRDPMLVREFDALVRSGRLGPAAPGTGD
jgi:putative two-component system response regulator